MPAKIKDADFPAHFWSRTKKQGRCIVWTGSRWKGYGSTGFRGGVTKTHRVAWILTRGRIPKGKHVLHRCDNPPCVKPSHLFLGTQADNNHDREAKGRGVYSSGEACSWAKLDWKKVCRIRKLYGTKPVYTMRYFAKQYKVDLKAILQVIQRKSWRKKR